MKSYIISSLFLLLSVCVFAQHPVMEQDTIVPIKQLDSITLIAYFNQNILRHLPEVQGTYLFIGKKTEVINLTQITADITNKTGRQVFAKIPSIFVYDMDGSGNQINSFSKNLELKVNLSNVTNKQYFTKRPTFYPGPGVWSSDGRNGNISLAIRI